MSPFSLGVLGSAHVAAPAGLLSFSDAVNGGTVAASPTTATVDIGTAAATRTVVVAIATDATTSLVRYPNAVTIGGVTATQDVNTASQAGGVSIWRATVPTGATADVVATWTGTSSLVSFIVYAFTAATALAVVATATGTDADADDAVPLTLAASIGGGVVAAAGMYNGAGSPTVTGADDVSIDGKRVAAYGPTATNPITVTFADPGGGGGARFRAAAVTYQGA